MWEEAKAQQRKNNDMTEVLRNFERIQEAERTKPFEPRSAFETFLQNDVKLAGEDIFPPSELNKDVKMPVRQRMKKLSMSWQPAERIAEPTFPLQIDQMCREMRKAEFKRSANTVMSASANAARLHPHQRTLYSSRGCLSPQYLITHNLSPPFTFTSEQPSQRQLVVNVQTEEIACDNSPEVKTSLLPGLNRFESQESSFGHQPELRFRESKKEKEFLPAEA